jgi:hypothetical protein
MSKETRPLEDFRDKFGRRINPDLWENDNLSPLDRGRWSADFNQSCERLAALANFDRVEHQGVATKPRCDISLHG